MFLLLLNGMQVHCRDPFNFLEPIYTRGGEGTQRVNCLAVEHDIIVSLSTDVFETQTATGS